MEAALFNATVELFGKFQFESTAADLNLLLEQPVAEQAQQQADAAVSVSEIQRTVRQQLLSQLTSQDLEHAIDIVQQWLNQNQLKSAATDHQAETDPDELLAEPGLPAAINDVCIAVAAAVLHSKSTSMTTLSCSSSCYGLDLLVVHFGRAFDF